LRGEDVSSSEKAGSTSKGDGQTIIFDVADLLSYFRNARLPTGIQRVQIEVVCGLLRTEGDKSSVRVCCFTEDQDEWLEIPARLFLRVCDLSLGGGDVDAPAWVDILEKIDLFLSLSKPVEFPEGACLINLGTSWWLQNYFLQVRRAKSRYGIKYVPFVHDLIPIMTPEHCIRELTRDFISWTLGVFQHADMFLVNSEATKRDLLKVADTLGHDVSADKIKVIRLDADFRRSSQAVAREDLLSRWGLKPDKFVLIVSTIESRKNHIGAFNAWLSLIRRHGVKNVPKLVCVGNAGWLNDAVHAKLASNDELRAHVVMLSRLSDDELASLYRHCLFTLYPSHYEGWGLPVTESLCYGKATLISDASSLPEAGGVFADYFSASSDISLAAAAETLIFDRDHRREREALIAAKFQPRRWADVGREIAAAVTILKAPKKKTQETGSRPPLAMPVRLGVYYPITRNFETRVWRGMISGEMFRAGAGWWWPDDWGVWTKPEGGDLAFRVDRPHKALRAYFRIRGVFETPSAWTLDFASPDGVRLAGRLGPDERRWVTVDFPASSGGSTVLGKLSGAEIQDLASRTNGLDARVTSIGLEGFYLCEAEDVIGRLALTEAITLGGLDTLTQGYGERPW
jgi:glycosyltransferase involved in cell wall biosynthesis